MKPAKSEKLSRDIAGFLASIRTAAVRLEGRTKVAAAVDAKSPGERDAIAKFTSFASALLSSVDECERDLDGLGKALAEKAG